MDIEIYFAIKPPWCLNDYYILFSNLGYGSIIVFGYILIFCLTNESMIGS